MVTIYSVGDSHARHTFEGVTCNPDVGKLVQHGIQENVKNIEVGPLTLENMVKERDGIKSVDILDRMLERLGIGVDDVVILSFGEIDIRCGVHVKIQKGAYLRTLMAGYCNDYMAVLKASRYRNMWVMSVIPPCRKDDVEENPSYPCIGSDRERAWYTMNLNEGLRQVCRRCGVTFFDIHGAYSDGDGLLRRDCTQDGVHISDTRMVQEQLDVYLRGFYND